MNLHFPQLRFCGGFYPRESFFVSKIVVYIYNGSQFVEFALSSLSTLKFMGLSRVCFGGNFGNFWDSPNSPFFKAGKIIPNV